MLSQEFSLKRSNLLYLFLSILFTGFLIYFAFGPYEKTRIIFEVNFLAAIILITFLVVTAIYSWYNLFNRSNVITFKSEGIIHKKKLIHWKNIKSYRTINYSSDSIDSLQLTLTLLNSNKEYNISLFGLNTDKQHIRTCIENYSSIFIIDEGHFEKN